MCFVFTYFYTNFAKKNTRVVLELVLWEFCVNLKKWQTYGLTHLIWRFAIDLTVSGNKPHYSNFLLSFASSAIEMVACFVDFYKL